MGFLGVALGAFGAHGLKELLTPEALAAYKTGVLYHLLHSVVILSIGLSSRPQFSKSAALLSAGIVLFSFSLYLYSITQLKVFALITPVGGLGLLVGWLLIIIEAVKLARQNDRAA